MSSAPAEADEIGDAAVAPKPEESARPTGHGREFVRSPGMPVEVVHRTGERTPFSYLVKPLADYFRRSLRDE